MNTRSIVLVGLLFTCVLLISGFTRVQQCNIVVFRSFETTLEPGTWHGFALGPSEEECTYLPEVSPLQKARNGAFVEKCVVQPEFDGHQWNDVLRVSIPATDEPMEVNIRVYRIAEMK